MKGFVSCNSNAFWLAILPLGMIFSCSLGGSQSLGTIDVLDSVKGNKISFAPALPFGLNVGMRFPDFFARLDKLSSNRQIIARVPQGSIYDIGGSGYADLTAKSRDIYGSSGMNGIENIEYELTLGRGTFTAELYPIFSDNILNGISTRLTHLYSTIRAPLVFGSEMDSLYSEVCLALVEKYGSGFQKLPSQSSERFYDYVWANDTSSVSVKATDTSAINPVPLITIVYKHTTLTSLDSIMTHQSRSHEQKSSRENL